MPGPAVGFKSVTRTRKSAAKSDAGQCENINYIHWTKIIIKITNRPNCNLRVEFKQNVEYKNTFATEMEKT